MLNNGNENFQARGFSTPPPQGKWRRWSPPVRQPLSEKQPQAAKTDLFHVIHKVPAGDSPYVRAKHVQVIPFDLKSCSCSCSCSFLAGLSWIVFSCWNWVSVCFPRMLYFMAYQNKIRTLYFMGIKHVHVTYVGYSRFFNYLFGVWLDDCFMLHWVSVCFPRNLPVDVLLYFSAYHLVLLLKSLVYWYTNW